MLLKFDMMAGRALVVVPARVHNFSIQFQLALANRTFQWVLLALAGVPIFALYAQIAVILCLSGAVGPTDFDPYITAAQALAHNSNPYAAQVAAGLPTAVSGGYAYPPLWAWLLQPVADQPKLGFLFLQVVAQVGVAIAIISLCWGLQLRSWRARTLLVLGVIAFEPLIVNFAWGQVMAVLFPLSCLWYAASARQKAWGHAFVGFGIAIKLLQAPVLLVALVRARWSWLAAAALAAGAATLVAAPQFLPTYLQKVLPGLSAGTGDIRNVALAGILTRLLHPGPTTPFGDPTFLDVKLLTYAFAGVVVGSTAWVMWRGRRQDGAALRCDLALAALLSPLVAPLLFDLHTPLVLPAIFALVHLGLARRRWDLVAAAVTCYGLFCVGGWFTFTTVVTTPTWVLEVLAELSFAALFALWAVALHERVQLMNTGRLTLSDPLLQVA